MKVKLCPVIVMVALVSMTFAACEPSGENKLNLDGGPPPLDDWWNKIESGGEIYDDFRYKIEDGEIRIIRYEGIGGEVTIPAEIEEIPVTTIGIHAFRERKLTSVVIPDSISFIGSNAFRDNQLASVVIPDSITSIEDGTFASNQLASVVIPNSITSIGFAAFAVNQLADVDIPDSVTYIGMSAFGDNVLTSVVIPNSVTYIGWYAFARNYLRSFTISNNVTKIESYTFSDNSFTSVVIPNSIAKIEYYAFMGNRNLVEITIGANVSVNNEAFGGYLINGNYAPSGFVKAYNNNRKMAGTYSRPDTTSNVWTRQK